MHARSRLRTPLIDGSSGFEAHGAREALDRRFRLAEPIFHPAAPKPCLGQIGIEHQRAIDQGGASAEIAYNKR